MTACRRQSCQRDEWHTEQNYGTLISKRPLACEIPVGAGRQAVVSACAIILDNGGVAARANVTSASLASGGSVYV